jgi:hypothetical protein
MKEVLQFWPCYLHGSRVRLVQGAGEAMVVYTAVTWGLLTSAGAGVMHYRHAFERLLRKLLVWKGQPALVLVHMYSPCKVQPCGQ